MMDWESIRAEFELSDISLKDLAEKHGIKPATLRSRKNRPEQVKDSIGDMYVVLTILSLQLGLDIEDCVMHAYGEIKDRKGKLIDGVFVKEADLIN